MYEIVDHLSIIVIYRICPYFLNIPYEAVENPWWVTLINFGTVNQPPIKWVPGTLSLDVKLPGREADKSPPSSTEAKNAWRYTSIPQYAFMA
jgi:hypothetical protein